MAPASSGRRRLVAPLVLLPSLWWAAPATAQGGAITGTVTDAESLRPVAGAQVFIEGTVIGTLSGPEGAYRLEGVPAGSPTLRVRLIGYRGVTQVVDVTAGQVATVDFALEQTALELQELVVTGLVGETPRIKLPFTVERIDDDDAPVLTSDVSALLSGRVPGGESMSPTGQPGQEAAINLRGPTSINNEGRDQSPLIVIDGVIQSESATLADIGALDIDHVEIVKGAAAASLYGSRAQTGVIQITTKRGTAIPGSSTDLMVRGEYGMAQLIGNSDFPRYHTYLMNEDGTKFIDSNGNEVDYIQFNQELPDGTIAGGPVPANESTFLTFQEHAYPTEAFDHLKTFYDPGETWTAYAAVAGRDGDLGYRVSGDYYREAGIVDCGEACRNSVALENFGDEYQVRDEGYRRGNARINIDASLGDLDIAASGFYSRSTQDDVAAWTGAFESLLRFNPYVDLTTPDEDGLPKQRADPLALWGNPLHSLATVEARNYRSRTMGGLDARWSILDWLSLEGNASYDRTILRAEHIVSSVNDWDTGRGLENDAFDEEAVNASVTLAAAETFLDGRLTTRLRLRALSESQSFDGRFQQGLDFSVEDVPNFGAIAGAINLGNEIREIRARGYFAIAGLDYEGRYILDGLIRRDGSSLFGPEERWHTYYRGSAAWRPSQEPWWNVGWVDELKLRASVGSAGGRPIFYSQYETYTVGAGGGIFPRVLGNPDLKPERSVERELGANLVLFDNLAIDGTYAWATTDDQILKAPLPGPSGYREHWINAGELSSRTWELSLRYTPIDNSTSGLNFRLNLYNTTSRITRFDVPAYTASSFYMDEGVPFGELWGSRFSRTCADVAAATGRLDADGFDCSQFQVNDEGYMVWVGEGSDFTDGVSKELWGTSGEVDGKTFGWGLPIQTLAQHGVCLREHPEDAGIGDQCPLQQAVPIANTTPDLHLGFSMGFRHRGLTVNALINGAIGFDLYNLPRVVGRDPSRDQAGKPEGFKKPEQYYGDLSTAFHAEKFEPGGWVKLRELAVGYTLPGAFTGRLFRGAVDRLTLSVVGRNLLTFTEYTGLDPESGVGGTSVGSATIDRWDQFLYPHSRTLSLALEVVF